MQVPPDFLKCVVFLAYDEADGVHWAGTGFIVGLPWPDGMRRHLYVVTAGHVIDALRDDGHDKVYLRLNFSDRPADLVTTRLAAWRRHPDPNVDVAILPVTLPPSVDHMNLPVEVFFIREEVAANKALNVGDEVFCTGLLWQRPGAMKNIPVVRVGNIAAMPGEPVETEYGRMVAYVMEARSLGGLSGSPVFVDLGGIRIQQGSISVHPPEFYLIGVAHGHWDVERRDREGEYVNMGLAIVTPAEAISDILKTEELRLIREMTEEEVRQQNLPTADGSA
jgi:hypothetical protein